ncbi:hypothetical protein GOL95_32575 [Sinorhizobium medicae]|nr:hypothetical protein [Sinorhizobium medicae]MDX1244574.1 hypothetical protein [Sinorhizobium medicae]
MTHIEIVSHARAFLLIAVTLQALMTVEAAAVDAPPDGTEVENFMLSNGMQVVVIPDHRSPVVTQAYGAIPCRDLPPRARPQEPEHNTKRTVALTDPRVTVPNFQKSWVAASHRTAEAGEMEALELLAETLGGGTRSRIYQELVVERGIASSGGANFVGTSLDYHASALVIGTATQAGRAAATLSIIANQVGRMANEGVTEEELEMAKKDVNGGFVIDNFGSFIDTVGSLVEIQLKNLGIDYISERQRLIQAVTAEDVRSAARRLLSATPAVMIVGPPLEGRKDKVGGDSRPLRRQHSN